MGQKLSVRATLFVFTLAVIVEVEYFSELALYDELPPFSLGKIILSFASFATQTFFQFLSIYYVNIQIIKFLDSKLSWDKSFTKRSISEFFLTTCAAVFITIPFLIWIDYGFLTPFWGFPTDGLVITLYYNILYIVVLNSLFIVSYEIFHLYIQRQKTQLNLEKTMRQNILTQFEALRYQVHPHFLFNSLESLLHLIKTDQKRALEFTENFTSIYRNVLKTVESPTITIEKELEFVRSYVFLQQIRFGDSFEVQFNVKSSGNIPPFAIQSLVENAIKHNGLSEKNPLKIDISENSGYIEITNNIIPQSRVSASGIGLTNLKDRYKLITDMRTKFERTETHFVAMIPILSA
ncbi:Histidine kinase [Ekhidna lutea]|uniref:Histidine kinase n=1 Tax=Ekhidna lutea TaxID=447679 RepID=A0A239EF39_EKHLU|nr:histidine kinase [Ekhidna lutea]SNS42502.1 Histidine kinase [Ekhidna lutea]